MREKALTDGFYSRDLRFRGPNGVGNGGAVEHVAGGSGNRGEDMPDLAILLGAAIDAAPIGNAAQAGQGRQWSVEDAQNLAEGDLVSRHQKSIAAELAPLAQEDAVALELKENLLEEFAGDALLCGDLADHHGVPGARQRDKGAKSIFCFLGDHEEMSNTLSNVSGR
jgi:hypothetical protein